MAGKLWWKRLTLWEPSKGHIVRDEYWPLIGANGLPDVIGFCWVDTGTNVIGFFNRGFCVVGIEYRGGDEPSVGIIFRNRWVGIWFPEPDED